MAGERQAPIEVREQRGVRYQIGYRKKGMWRVSRPMRYRDAVDRLRTVQLRDRALYAINVGAHAVEVDGEVREVLAPGQRTMVSFWAAGAA